MTFKNISGAIFAACVAISPINAAQAQSANEEAENIRKLNIMLMVTSLRCRQGAHDFRAEYERFSAMHLATLNRAGEQLQGQLRAEYGNRGSERALDRVGVQMANSYGDGHPWLNCEQLKQVAHNLSLSGDRAMLSREAVRLLAAQQPPAPTTAAAFSPVPGPASSSQGPIDQTLLVSE
ncbi:MAG: S-adenosyl-L-homocysteine hydrolase [Erythrobacter sp.]